MDNPLRIFGLSPKASTVLSLVKAGHTTPVQIAKHANISRPAIYAILQNLAKQGLVEEKKSEEQRYWQIAHISQINSLLESAKDNLLGHPEERGLQYKTNGVQVHIYRGKETIAELLKHLFINHRGQTCVGIQGDNVYEGWKEVLGIEFINELNKGIKKNKMIIQAIVPQGNFARAVETMGLEWAKHFEGRTYRVNEIAEKYFNHKGEMFLFKDSIYLISMTEQLVIEIKHSHIQKQLLALIEYVQETAKVIDGNEALRKIISSS